MNSKLTKCWHLNKNRLISKDICNVSVRKKNKIIFHKTLNINYAHGQGNYVKNTLVISYCQRSLDSRLLLSLLVLILYLNSQLSV